MADAAYAANGRDDLQCTVPHCSRFAIVLDHRIAWSTGGKTCVRNLYPMYEQHNLAKGDTEYNLMAHDA
jgi:hypothetical protein